VGKVQNSFPSWLQYKLALSGFHQKRLLALQCDLFWMEKAEYRDADSVSRDRRSREEH